MYRTKNATRLLTPVGRSVLAAIAFLAALSARARAANDSKPILFGIVPQQSASRVAEAWTPLIDELRHRTGLNIEFATAHDIPTFETCLEAGVFDLAYMNPYHYVVMAEISGYRALAHSTQRLQGIVVAKRDGPVVELKDLDGLEVAFPAPAAFGATLLPRAEIAAAGLTISPRFVNSHNSVYRAVASGLVPAGGGIMRTFDNVPGEIRDNLKIIYTTHAYTPHALAASPAMDNWTTERVTAAVVALGETPSPALEKLGIDRFERASDKEWDDIRRLNISRAGSGIKSGGRGCPFD